MLRAEEKRLRWWRIDMEAEGSDFRDLFCAVREADILCHANTVAVSCSLHC